MSMLWFFSFVVGLVFREWHNCQRLTIGVLVEGLLIMMASLGLTTYGSMVGDREAAKTAAKTH